MRIMYSLLYDSPIYIHDHAPIAPTGTQNIRVHSYSVRANGVGMMMMC